MLDTTRRERRCWVVWEEDGKSPDVVIELLSPSTEHIDRGEKKRIYSRLLRTLEYFLFDAYTGVLEGFDLNAERDYVPKAPDAQERLFSNQLKLWLGKSRSVLYGTEVDWLRWMSPAGEVLRMPQAEVLAEAERANAEAARAARLEAELAELKKQLAQK